MKKTAIFVMLVGCLFVANVYNVFSLRQHMEFRHDNKPIFHFALTEAGSEEYTFMFNRIFEFIDSNHNGRYDSSDRVLFSASIKQFSWKHYMHSKNNSSVYVFSGKYFLGGHSHKKYYALNFTLNLEELVVGNIKIENWTWSSDSSSLCLEFLVSSSTKAQIKQVVTNKTFGLELVGANSKFVVAFNNTVQIDNYTTNVSVDSTDNRLLIDLPSFNNSANLEFIVNVSLIDAAVHFTSQQLDIAYDSLLILSLVVLGIIALNVSRVIRLKKLSVVVNSEN